MRPGRTSRAAAAAGVGALLFVAACGSAADPGAVVEVTRPAVASTTGGAGGAATSVAPSSTPTTARAATTTTTIGSTADVTLAGATQETAAPGNTTTSPAPKVTVPIDAPTPSGYQRAADPDGLVSIAVPSSWTFLSLDDKMLQDIANQGSQAFPEATRAQMAAAVAAAGDYIKVLGVGPIVGGRAATVSVIITPAAVPVSIMKALYPKQIESAGSKLVGLTDITISGREALRADIELTLAQGTAQSHQLVVPITNATVIVSISGTDDAALATMIDSIVIPPGS
jgi:hypothetical protein